MRYFGHSILELSSCLPLFNNLHNTYSAAECCFALDNLSFLDISNIICISWNESLSITYSSLNHPLLLSLLLQNRVGFSYSIANYYPNLISSTLSYSPIVWKLCEITFSACRRNFKPLYLGKMLLDGNIYLNYSE